MKHKLSILLLVSFISLGIVNLEFSTTCNAQTMNPIGAKTYQANGYGATMDIVVGATIPKGWIITADNGYQTFYTIKCLRNTYIGNTQTILHNSKIPTGWVVVSEHNTVPKTRTIKKVS